VIHSESTPWSIGYGLSNGMPVYAIGVLVYTAWAVRGRQVGYVWWWLGAGLGLPLLFNLVTQSLFHVRHVLVALLPLVLLLAAGIVDLSHRSRWMGGTLVALWVGLGFYSYFTPGFMNNQPGHVRQVPLSAMSTIRNMLDQCARENDVAIFYTQLPERESVDYFVLYHYLYYQPLRYAQLATMQAIPGNDRTPPTGDADYIARVQALITGADAVWVFMLTDLPPIDQLTRLDNTVRAAGYGYRGEIVDQPSLRGYIFTANAPVDNPSLKGLGLQEALCTG